jgi:hypothetical protein
MKKGIIAGVISGALAGIIPFFIYQIYSAVGILESKIYTIMFLVRQVTIHIGFNALWGAVFGIIFALIFDKLPGKGIVKGLWIGLIYFIFSIVRSTMFVISWGMVIWGFAFILGVSLEKFVYGILFVTLYKEKA